VTDVLQTLARLEQRAESQTSALQDLKRVAPVLSVGKPLLKEIKAHRLEMEATLAALTALWCKDSSVAMRLKQELRSKLQEGIECSRHMGGELTGAGASDALITKRGVIDVDKPGKALNCELVHRTHQEKPTMVIDHNFGPPTIILAGRR
jgi:hypothetical protein